VGLNAWTTEDVEPGVPPGDEHLDEILRYFPPGKKHLKDLVPKYFFQILGSETQGNPKDALTVKAAVCAQNV
jgi:hypothetical protein